MDPHELTNDQLEYECRIRDIPIYGAQRGKVKRLVDAVHEESGREHELARPLESPFQPEDDLSICEILARSLESQSQEKRIPFQTLDMLWSQVVHLTARLMRVLTNDAELNERKYRLLFWAESIRENIERQTDAQSDFVPAIEIDVQFQRKPSPLPLDDLFTPNLQSAIDDIALRLRNISPIEPNTSTSTTELWDEVARIPTPAGLTIPSLTQLFTPNSEESGIQKTIYSATTSSTGLDDHTQSFFEQMRQRSRRPRVSEDNNAAEVNAKETTRENNELAKDSRFPTNVTSTAKTGAIPKSRLKNKELSRSASQTAKSLNVTFSPTEPSAVMQPTPTFLSNQHNQYNETPKNRRIYSPAIYEAIELRKQHRTEVCKQSRRPNENKASSQISRSSSMDSNSAAKATPKEYKFPNLHTSTTVTNPMSYHERSESETKWAAQLNEIAQLKENYTRLNDSQSQMVREHADEIARLKRLCARMSDELKEEREKFSDSRVTPPDEPQRILVGRNKIVRRSSTMPGIEKTNELLKPKDDNKSHEAYSANKIGADRREQYTINGRPMSHDCSRYTMDRCDSSNDYASSHDSRNSDRRNRRDTYPGQYEVHNRRIPMPSDDSPSDSDREAGRRGNRDENRERNSGQWRRDRTGNSQPITMALKPVPVNQWRVCFSGDPKPTNKYDVSIHKFIATVECICTNASIPMNAILSQIIHLLAGSALDWYQSEAKNIRTWDEFVQRLKSNFLPLSHDYELVAQANRRKQGKKEPVAIYINAMRLIFSAMSTPLRTEHQLFLVRQNLNPSLVRIVASHSPRNIEDVLRICKEIESAQNIEIEPESRQSRPYIRQVNEVAQDEDSSSGDSDTMSADDTKPPQVAAARDDRKSKSDKRNTVATKTDSKSNTVEACYNCGGEGHLKRDCKLKWPKHCFRCGEKGVVLRDCPKCNEDLTKMSKNAKVNSVEEREDSPDLTAQ